MLDIQIKKAKVVTRLIADIAIENNLNQVHFGETDENFTEEEFNSIHWFGKDVKFFRQNETPKLPSPVTWEEFKQRLDVELSKVEYVYNRKAEYPTVEDQLDMIFKDIDAWRDAIQAIKDKYPKE